MSAAERLESCAPCVAAAIVDAVLDGRGLVPVTPEAWAMYALERALPETTSRLVHRLAERARQKRGN